MRVLAALLFILSTAVSASDLMGPVWHLQGKHVGDGEPLNWSIDYYDQWGRTVADANGLTYYHDRLGGDIQFDYSKVMPQQYWGVYPMYYLGTTMRYTVTVSNESPDRTYQHLRVVAIQEYFTEDETWGERMGPDAAKDWYVPQLGPGESVVLEGSMWISENMRAGIDQTHIQVQHWNPGSGQPGPGSVIIDDAKAALWCPPELGAASSLDQGAEEATAAEVTIAGGERGYVEAGQPAEVEVRTAEAGDVRVRIYDRRGLIVWETASFLGAGVVEIFRWDGRDYSGAAVTPGIYMLAVQGPGIQAREKIAVVR
jgi:hypothetical protein